MRILLITFLMGMVISPLWAQKFFVGYKQKGKASYYANKYHGKKTASGDTYNMYEMTAAHREIPYNSIIKVTNLDNGKWVTLRVNDRGPFSKKRIIDVSKKAALKLDMVKEGQIEVELEVLKMGDTDSEEKPEATATAEEKKQEAVAKKEAEEKPNPKSDNKSDSKKEQAAEKVADAGKAMKPATTKSSTASAKPPTAKKMLTEDNAQEVLSKVGTYDLSGNKTDLKGYGLQVAAFSEVEKALKIAKEAHNLGLLDTYIQTGWSGGQRVYRILIGEAATEDDVLAFVPLVKKKGFYNVRVKQHYENK